MVLVLIGGQMMPCSDGGGWGHWTEEETKAWARHRSEIAEIMCEMCAVLEQQGVALTPRAAVWWREHKERDRERALAELEKASVAKERKAALDKLSKHERRLLGLKD